MIAPNNATLLRLTGDVRLKQRVQHPRVQECRDRKNPYWFPLAVFPIVFPLTYYLTMVVPRYRLPIDPVLILLTAIGIANLGVRPSENGNPTVAAVPR